jgi:hypothetical protein
MTPLQSIVVPSLVLSMGLENANHVKETFELTWPGLVVSPIAAWPLYIGHRAVKLPLLIVPSGGARLIGLTQLPVHLGLAIIVGDGQYLLECLGFLCRACGLGMNH